MYSFARLWDLRLDGRVDDYAGKKPEENSVWKLYADWHMKLGKLPFDY